LKFNFLLFFCHQMLAAIYLLLHLSLLVRNSASRFTQAVCRPPRLCVQRNTANTSWCFVPTAVDTVVTDCIGEHLDLANVVKVHAAQDLSIAYYNGLDDQRLGGADWPFPIGAGVYRLCVSGRAGEGLVQTLCFNVAGDNTLDGTPWCGVTFGPQVVSDGCYSPERLPTPTASSSSVSSSSVSSTSSPLSSSSSSKNSPGSSLSSTSTGSLPPQGTPSASASSIIIDNSHKTNKAATIAAPVVLGIVVLIAVIVILMLREKNQLLRKHGWGPELDPGGRN